MLQFLKQPLYYAAIFVDFVADMCVTRGVVHLCLDFFFTSLKERGNSGNMPVRQTYCINRPKTDLSDQRNTS